MTLNLNQQDYKIRFVTEYDKEILLTWRNKDFIRHNMYTNHLITPEEHTQWFNKVLVSQKHKSFIFSYKEKDIGFCGFYNLDYDNQTASWTFHIGEPENIPKGSGLVLTFMAMNYFFNDLKFRKLCGEALSFNQKSITMHQRFGYQTEGILKEHFYRDGCYHDIYIFAIFKEQWAIQQLKSEQELFT